VLPHREPSYALAFPFPLSRLGLSPSPSAFTSKTSPAQSANRSRSLSNVLIRSLAAHTSRRVRPAAVRHDKPLGQLLTLDASPVLFPFLSARTPGVALDGLRK